MVDITYVDHAEEGLSLLPSHWENSPNLRAILEAWLTPLNATEQCALDVRGGFNVRTAIGNQLDIIGDYFDETRDGRDDDEYRSAILSVISAAIGSGTPDQLMDLFAGITNSTSVSYWEHYPLSIALLSTEGEDVDIHDPQYMQNATAGGVEYVALMYNPFSYAWIGTEAAKADAFLVTNEGEFIVTDASDNIVVEAVFEDANSATGKSSFIDKSLDQDPVGYGEKYGEAYGGRDVDTSEFCEASFKDNNLVVNGGNGFVLWASTAQIDPLTGTTNKRKPIPQYQNTGIKSGQPLPRMFFNWMMANIDDWFNNYSQRSEIGTIKMTIDVTQTATDYDDRFGGTWQFNGTQLWTTSNETTYVFERTS